MIAYNATLPLIGIHVPKAAGTSAGKVFKHWFGKGYIRHYYDEKNKRMPQKQDIFALHTMESPVFVYGHFNRLRGFGVSDYYPEARQFITILRDPFELMVSSYFFARRVKTNPGIDTLTLQDYIMTKRINMLNHFPVEITADNYQEVLEGQFIAVGIAEQLDESLRRIAARIGKPYSSDLLEHVNATARQEAVPYDLKPVLLEKHPLEFAVYNYALEKFNQSA